MGHSGGSGAKPPEALFNAETAFQTQTYIGLRKILPFPTTNERPRAVALASSACVDKTTKIITGFTRKDPFLHLNEGIKYCKRYHL